MRYTNLSLLLTIYLLTYRGTGEDLLLLTGVMACLQAAPLLASPTVR